MVRDWSWKTSAASAVALGVGLAVIPMLNPPCDAMVPTAMGGAMPMRCAYTYRVEAAIVVVLLLVAFSSFLLVTREARRLSGMALALLGALAAAIPRPWIIGTCGGGTCHSGGLWFAIGGLALTLVGVHAALRASGEVIRAASSSSHARDHLA